MRLFFFLFVLSTPFTTIEGQIFVNQNAIGNNDGTSWTNAFTNLQDAIDQSIDGNQIWVAEGTYIPDGPSPDSSHFLALTAVEIYGGFDGTESNLNERDWESNPTLLSGDINGDDIEGEFFVMREDNAHHVLIVNAGSGETIIDGLIFIGGTTRQDAYNPDSTDVLGYDRWSGGAIFIKSTSSQIRNCFFVDNSGFQGSGLYAIGDTNQIHRLRIEDSRFQSNLSTEGGALWFNGWNESQIRSTEFLENESDNFGGGFVMVNANALIEDCSFYENIAASAGGSCFFSHNSQSLISYPSLQFKRCFFYENSAGLAGGALHLINYSSGFRFSIDSCGFTGNFTFGPNSNGGAIQVDDEVDPDKNEQSSLVRIGRTAFTGNSSNFGGAVIVNAEDDSLHIDITQTGFYNNQCPVSGSGGGLYVLMYGNAYVQMQIKNSIFDGNRASGGGGGIILDNFINNHRLSYVIDSCTFSQNMVASIGGAMSQFLFLGPSPVGSIQNSRFLRNEAPGLAGAIYSFGESLLIDNCLFFQNYTQGIFSTEYNGGGAIVIESPEVAVVRNTIFQQNRSDHEGAAVFLYGKLFGIENTRFENTLFLGNAGNSSVLNDGSLNLVNSTLVDNDLCLQVKDSSYTEIQNSVFKNDLDNLQRESPSDIVSKGGNISSDGSMAAVLTGYNNYNDLHNTDPMLDPDNIPQSNSPCIDAGNPEGITFPYDLAGNPRIYGNNIDAGCYETFFVSTKDVVWDASGFSVFPNPVQDDLNIIIESDWIGDVHLVVYNLQGQAVEWVTMVKTEIKQAFKKNIHHLPSGEYVLLAGEGDVAYAAIIVKM